ncbi:MAG: hypothetical protein HRU28_16545 [Rhizobiales bacterium]|nr:hypothetical protein [Hyphomicrobiales bacterium]
MAQKAALSDIEKTRRRLKKQGKDVKVDFVLVDKDEKPEAVVRILDNDPIRKLYNRGTITLEQFEAAEKLYSDWYNGGMSPRLVKPFKIREIDEGQADMSISDFKIDCNKRYHNAIDFIRSRSIIVIVQEVILESMSISDCVRRHHPSSNTNVSRALMLDRLQIGLDDLIDFYESKI